MILVNADMGLQYGSLLPCLAVFLIQPFHKGITAIAHAHKVGSVPVSDFTPILMLDGRITEPFIELISITASVIDDKLRNINDIRIYIKFN